MHNKKEQRSKKNRAALIVILVLAALAMTGTLLAKYISSNRQHAEMLSSDFRVSSNYLEATAGATYTVTDTGSGITFQLYNYAKENVALVSSEPVRYKIEVDHGWIVTVEEDGHIVAPDSEGAYTIPSSGKVSHSIRLSGGSSTSVSVSVNTVSPYVETLSAVFHLEGKTMPDYSVTNYDTYVMVTVHSNDYAGPVVVKWTSAFSPDNTDPIMATWTDDSPVGNMTLEAHTTYSLIFLKNIVGSYSKDTTYGTTFEIGGGA